MNKLLSPLLFSLLIYSDNHSNYFSEFLQVSLVSFAVKNSNNKNNNIESLTCVTSHFKYFTHLSQDIYKACKALR